MYNFDQYKVTGSAHGNIRNQDKGVVLMGGFTFILVRTFKQTRTYHRCKTLCILCASKILYKQMTICAPF